MGNDGAGRPDQVAVSVLHASFDCAEYALMVGVYADEEMSGAERFLDRQYGQLLSAWQDLGHYPGVLGTSVFVEPGHDVPDGSEPVGAYLVGLGTSLTLGPRQLRFAVYRTLIERCLRLYRPDGSAVDGPTGIGVSTALLGIRDDSGLRIEDSVAAILEGIRDVNERLAEHERGRQLQPGIGIRHVQFVERFAHRVDLAASAVRRSRSTASLPDNFVGLEQVTVREGEGALPAGAATLEQDRSWTRFAVTERAGSDGATGTSLIEVTALGRDARADRITHPIDRSSLEALTARLTLNQTDTQALHALRDRLIPYDLRAEFLSGGSLQLVVDSQTAAHSWEQLAAPAREAGRTAQRSGTGSVLRAFTESDDRRLQPTRARPGSALVIGAGNTVPGTPLPEAVEEAEKIHHLLLQHTFSSTLLTDGQGPFNLADLNVHLLGDHQILHLAGHGNHVEGDTAASGVLLTPAFRFTADFVNSMTVVPELVVLNSCYNARIGLNRLAAGLARALMQIGVRAVVAAGWPVGDAAAKAFALTLHTDMLAGRTFGDAVTNARRVAAGIDHDSWAAYQCYGDPTFVLRGLTSGLDRVERPVSLADLRNQVETLRVQVADLSRPRPGAQTSRRDQLVESFNALTRCAESDYPLHRYPELRQLLAQAARELGEFDEAARWYLTFAADTAGTSRGTRRPRGRTVNAEQLQQAANCVARAAQTRHRTGKAIGDLSFRTAESLARGAIAILPDDEGLAILASVYKKWATTASTERQRDALLDKAEATYERIASHTRGDYGVENRIHVMALRDAARARGALAEIQTRTPPDHAGPAGLTDEPLRDAANRRGEDFWSRSAVADRLLTDLMTMDDDAADNTQRIAAGNMVAAYRRAFRSRSTYAERYSSIDHLQDLAELLPDGQQRKELLLECLHQLAEWSRFQPSEAPTYHLGSTPPTRPGSLERSQVAAQVTALPAARGECLLLEYTGATGEQHRILLDGGLRSAFGRGLGSVLGPTGAPTSVDVAVITHVDGDHIEGVIEALRSGRLVAADFWFNGRDQIAGPDEPGHTRSARQGDALSSLIPDDRRNVVAEGRALVVRDGGPPELPLPGGAVAVLLTPSRERLAALLERWPSRHRGEDPIQTLLTAFDEQPDGQVGRGPVTFGRDSSVANGSGIAFLFEHAGVSALFTADAWAEDLAASLRALLERRNRTRPATDQLHALPVQLFKLSHHGSRNNVTDDLLTLIRPEQILVCTNGSKFGHPDADALELVRRHYPDVPIHFTDASAVIRERAARIGAAVPTTFPVVIPLTTPSED